MVRYLDAELDGSKKQIFGSITPADRESRFFAEARRHLGLDTSGESLLGRPATLSEQVLKVTVNARRAFISELVDGAERRN